MATKFSFARLFFHVPEKEISEDNHDKFESALKKLSGFVELDMDFDNDMDEDSGYYIIVMEGRESDIPVLEKKIDQIVDKLNK